MWLCKCECGKEKITNGNSLRAGYVKSCGCSFSEFHKCKKFAPGVANMRQVINNYKQRTRKRGIEYNLTEEQFEEITQKDCYYCGAKPNNVFSRSRKGNNGNYIYNGLDRIDNIKGYTIDNIVPCCKQCNTAKNTLTLKEFQDWAKRLYSTILKGE